MNQVIAVIGQNPLGVLKTLHADGMFAALLELDSNFFADGLDLLRIAPAADYKEVGERGNTAQIENPNVTGFFRFCGADGREPRGAGGRRGR